MFPFISIMNIINGDSILLSSLFLLITFTFSCLLIYSICTLNRLTRIAGISSNRNKSILKKSIEGSDWYVYVNNQQMTIFKKDWKWTSTNWGQEIVILYDNKDILINAVSYGKGEMKSPFHWFVNRKIERKFQQKFEEYIRLKQGNS